MITKTNITVSIDADVLKDFKEIAAKKGLKISTFINSKLKEFIEEGYHEQLGKDSRSNRP